MDAAFSRAVPQLRKAAGIEVMEKREGGGFPSAVSAWSRGCYDRLLPTRSGTFNLH